MEKLSDLFSYKEDNEELSYVKHSLNEGIDKVLEKEGCNKDILLLMKELLNSSHNSMDDYYKE